MNPIRRRWTALVVVSCVLVSACASNEPPAASDPAPADPAPSTPVENLDPERTFVAGFEVPIAHYSQSEGGESDGMLEPSTGAFDGFVVAAPYDRFATRYEIHLDDGQRTWVDAADVTVESTNVVVVGKGTEVDPTGNGGGVVPVFAQPGDPEPVEQITNPKSADGLNVAPVVFLAHGPYDPTEAFVDVYLPVRPNGSTGFVRASDVEVSTNRFRIEVSLGAHELKVFDGDDLVHEDTIGVGTGNTPTPGGVFYIRSLIASTDPLYGTYAFGLSGFSDVHDAFNGGPGDIGIHGTNDPSTIGTDVSNGCIRLYDFTVVHLASLLPEAGADQSEDPQVTTGLGVPVAVFA